MISHLACDWNSDDFNDFEKFIYEGERIPEVQAYENVKFVI